MYLGRSVRSFYAKDDATLVVPRAHADVPSREVKAEPPTPQTVVVERIIEKPVIVERVIEVEKIIEVPVAIAAEPESNFFDDHVPTEWVEQSAKAPATHSTS